MSARAAESGSGRTKKLPARFRYAGNETRGSEFAESDTGNLKPAKERAAATGDAAAVDEPCRACVARKLSEGGVVFFSLQFRAESRIFFNCFLFALIALEPCCFCHKGREEYDKIGALQVFKRQICKKEKIGIQGLRACIRQSRSLRKRGRAWQMRAGC